MLTSNELWVAEYSPTQNNFHIDTLAQSLATNREIFGTGVGDAWMILGIFDDYKEASNFTGSLQRIRDARGELK